jgi:hypothetical protein
MPVVPTPHLKRKVFETGGLSLDLGIYHFVFDPTMRGLPRLRIFLAPLFKDSILGGGFGPA